MGNFNKDPEKLRKIFKEDNEFFKMDSYKKIE